MEALGVVFGLRKEMIEGFKLPAALEVFAVEAFPELFNPGHCLFVVRLVASLVAHRLKPSVIRFLRLFSGYAVVACLFHSKNVAKEGVGDRLDIISLALSARFRSGADHFWPAPGGGTGQLYMELELSSDEERSAFAIYEEQRLCAALANGALELRDVADGLMVDFLDDVALLEAGVGHFARGIDAGDDNAFGRRGNV